MNRALLAAMLLLASLAAPTRLARADEFSTDAVPILKNIAGQREAAAASRRGLRVSAGLDPDTVYVGYSQTDHWSAANNYWNIWTGTRRPGTNDPNNASWDWDNLSILAAHGVGDSLAGWWPVNRLYNTTGGFTLPDDQRPWWAIDHGNEASYVINQGAGGKRTPGVVGVWHADPGKNAGNGVLWTPLSGTKSAWCGLRQLNDLSVTDAVTGQPFNQAAVDMMIGGGVGAGRRSFPGYANQWDQMLYRDVAAPAGQPLDISFLYRTRMSTGVVTAAATRTGWFHGDPLNAVAGNFISSSAAGAGAPADSFSVYVGAPVDEANCTYSDGSVGAVYDVQRRWFSEVVRMFDGSPLYCLFSVAGNNPADTLAATPTANLTLPAPQVDAIRAVSGGIVRIVFRIKTNRSFSDSDGSPSYSRGAALLDDVTVNGSVIGDFELAEQGGVNAIDNRPGASPLNNWKSTGKPPSIYPHLGNLEQGINYAEMCGAWDSPARFCDIRGNVMMMGNYDVFEAMSDPRYLSMRESFAVIQGPTVNMSVARDGSNAVNPHGLTQSMVTTTDGIYLFFDIYAGQLNLTFTGVGYQPGFMVYPIAQSNGARVWSEPIYSGFLVFNPDPQCYGDWYSLSADIGIPAVANTYNVPDSLRIRISLYQACFRWGVTIGCNDNDGVYFDNVSLGFVDDSAVQASATNAISAGPLSATIWQWVPDAFPANETALLPASANFDTAAALIKGPLNTAPATGNQLRFDILADSLVVTGTNVSGSTDPTFGNQTRVDMVFRILPGPGNYAIASPGGRTFPPTASMQLLDVPTNQANFVTSGDGTFWGEFMADPGKFSSGTHHGGAYWDHLTWNSARCDSSELNIFPVSGKITGGLVNGNWSNMLHDADPRFATLGITKFRCFMVDTAGTAANANIVCDGTVPAWLTTVPQSRTGWDGTNTTKEYTKIVPDGLLTPGAHVQYFFRKSGLADSSIFTMVPDTTQVQQNGEGPSTDGHRWQQFGVLPDRWKDAAFGGAGMACMLYVDWSDRRGNERVFVSLMDSLGGTAAAKFGAHNGWHAPRLAGPLLVSDLAAYPVHGRNQQPGTTWDMYGVKASESGATGGVSLGARLANRASMGFLAGKTARTAPTPEMLRRFYRMLTILTGDLKSGVTGPFFNKSIDDIGILSDFLTGNDPGSTAQPRGLLIGGDGFVQNEDILNGQNASHGLFLSTKLGLTLRNGSYQAVSNNTNDCADVITTGVITTNGDVYGVGNSCAFSNDLLQRNPVITEAVEATYYENVGANGPYVAAIHKPAVPARDWVAYTEGWDIEHLWSRYCETANGRMAYYYNTYNALFSAQCQVFTGGPALPLDVPQAGEGALFTRFLEVGNSVLRSGEARVRFGLAGADRVRIRMYDVTGRRVRTLADRSFPAGEHELAWDGADDDGGAVARGVYFARVEYAKSGEAISRRIVVLK